MDLLTKYVCAILAVFLLDGLRLVQAGVETLTDDDISLLRQVSRVKWSVWALERCDTMTWELCLVYLTKMYKLRILVVSTWWMCNSAIVRSIDSRTCTITFSHHIVLLHLRCYQRWRSWWCCARATRMSFCSWPEPWYQSQWRKERLSLSKDNLMTVCISLQRCSDAQILSTDPIMLWSWGLRHIRLKLLGWQRQRSYHAILLFQDVKDKDDDDDDEEEDEKDKEEE